MLELLLEEDADCTREGRAFLSPLEKEQHVPRPGERNYQVGLHHWGSWAGGAGREAGPSPDNPGVAGEELGHTLLVLTCCGLWLLEEGQGSQHCPCQGSKTSARSWLSPASLSSSWGSAFPSLK